MSIEKIPLSVAVITKNESANLPRCLESVHFASQVVIVDSGSTDDTLRIAKDAGCDIFSELWCGFGPQKQMAVDRCREPWILILDADERIPDETAVKIREIILADNSSVSGYSFPRKNFFQDRWIRHAGWWPDKVIRLFRKSKGRMTNAPVHEAVEVDGEVKYLPDPIEHFTESRLSEILLKIDQYSTLGAEEAFRSGKKSTVASAVLRAALTFFQDYLLRLGFLDGPQGMILAMTDATNKFFKYAKLAKLSRKQRQA
ncbi:MAG: glycosyltransferase family 2 protein [Syntrophales bacterium]|jgi:glycosyltransferase involved in cell wall biosynthesis